MQVILGLSVIEGTMINHCLVNGGIMLGSWGASWDHGGVIGTFKKRGGGDCRNICATATLSSSSAIIKRFKKRKKEKKKET